MGSPEPDQARLRSLVEELEPLERFSGSEGERRAAELIAERLRGLGCSVEIEEERVHGTFTWPLGLLSAVGCLAALAGLRGRRIAAVLGGLVAAAAIADDISGGRRPFRALLPQRSTWNVVAEAGDRAAARTVVVLAHHDAARSGLVFHPAPQRAVEKRFPGLIERTDTGLPLWFPVVGGPLLGALGALTGRRGLMWAGAVMATLNTAFFADIASRPVVPGANDNLTGVAGLVALAQALSERPVHGLRVLLVSCGSEESLQEGVRAFGARHFARLPPERTWFVNLESVGSPKLALLEGEGPLVMRDYDANWREAFAQHAAGAGVPLRRGLRARLTTDSSWPHRHGYRVATLISITRWKSVANYHWPSDVSANVDYSTVAQAVTATEAAIRGLAAEER